MTAYILYRIKRGQIMRYRKLGKWGLKVSEIALGSWMTNLAVKESKLLAESIIDKAFEKGVNFFDCADAYSGGEAEKFLGNTLKKFPRNSYVVSSKVFFPMGSGPNDYGLSRKHIIEQVDKSLKNMNLDYLDMYFCHRFDPETPMEETFQVLSDLIAQGKILYYGVSEWSPVQISEALRVIEKMNLRPLSVIQPQYNMFDRYIEDEIMGICDKNGIGIVGFSPLAQGLLTGKYRKNEMFPDGSRATFQEDKQINNLMTMENMEKVEELVKISRELGISMAELSLTWLLRRKEMSSVIIGASKINQLENNIKASGLEISKEYLDRIEKILNYKPFFRRIG